MPQQTLGKARPWPWIGRIFKTPPLRKILTAFLERVLRRVLRTFLGRGGALNTLAHVHCLFAICLVCLIASVLFWRAQANADKQPSELRSMKKHVRAAACKAMQHSQGVVSHLSVRDNKDVPVADCLAMLENDSSTFMHGMKEASAKERLQQTHNVPKLLRLNYMDTSTSMFPRNLGSP